MTINDIVQRIYFLTKTDSTSYVAADMLIAINNAYNRVASLILSSDNRWQWDDDNYTTDLPIGSIDLISGQADYTLAVAHLKVLRVECATSSAGTNFIKLPPYDQKDEDGSLKYLSTLSGVPERYDELGASVLLDPKPNFNCRLANEGIAGLRVHFQRGPQEFTSAEVTTGTKVPGFNSLYHDLIPLWASYDYWLINDQSMATRYLNEITLKEETLKKDYNGRNNDDHKNISIQQITFM